MTLMAFTGCLSRRNGSPPTAPSAGGPRRQPASASVKKPAAQPGPRDPAPVPDRSAGHSGQPTAPAPNSNAPAAGAEKTPPPIYSVAHDTEIKAVFDLADKGQWEQAEGEAVALAAKSPDDPAVRRILNWVRKQRELRRNQALEDRIRDIDAKSSVFNPTVADLLKEKKDRGLPPRKDVRDAVGKLEATPYIPETFGRVRREKGLLFDVETPEGRMAKILEKEISVHLDNVTLESIIFNIGQAEGINFVADKSLAAFKQTLSVNMDKVKLSEFLRYLSRNLDLQFQVGEDLIWVVDGKDPKRLLEETRVFRLRRGFILPAQFGAAEVISVTVTNPAQNLRTTSETQKWNRFVNDGAAARPSIETAITNFFSGSRYLIDYERNLIVARGTREQLEVLEKLIEEFDRPIQQVLIEARFVTVTHAAFLQLGALWETGRGPLTSGRTPVDFSGLGANIGNLGLGLQESFTNVLSRANLSATLTAMEQGGESQTLSSPRLTLLNNLPATITDGKIQYYYEEYQVKQTILERRSTSSFVPSGKPVKLTSGVSLDVLASIGADGKTILLALKPQVNQDVKLVTFATLTDVDEAGKIVSTFDIRLPEFRTQELSTRVLVRSGETVVMGGVLEREQRTFVESVPILGNIPILGAAFRRRTEIDKPRYLLIFVTATLLSDTGEFLLYDDELKRE
jgi:type IV pilus assembly protein PilQ